MSDLKVDQSVIVSGESVASDDPYDIVNSNIAFLQVRCVRRCPSFPTMKVFPVHIERGILKSLLFGMVGFLIPVAVLGTIAACEFAFVETHPLDREKNIQSLPSLIFTPALGCGIVFALAAFASFTPNSGVSFLRSLLIIGSVVVLALFAMQPDVRYKMPNANAWIEFVVPLVAGGVASVMIIASRLLKRGVHLADVPKDPNKRK